MIDLHCHLLPGIDDGSPDLAAAVAMGRALTAAGVTTVTATPHVSPDFPNTAETIAPALLGTRAALAEAGVVLDVLRGAELDLVHVEAFEPAHLELLQLGSSGTLLVECPFAPSAPFFEQRVAKLAGGGYRVLLAHPERSPAFVREPALLERLVGAGALASLTASSLTGRFGRRARSFAGAAIDAGLVHDVASDAHDVAGRPPGMRAPLEEAGYGWAADWLTEEAPAAILAGAALPAPPARPKRRWPSLRRGSGATVRRER